MFFKNVSPLLHFQTEMANFSSVSLPDFDFPEEALNLRFHFTDPISFRSISSFLQFLNSLLLYQGVHTQLSSYNKFLKNVVKSQIQLFEEGSGELKNFGFLVNFGLQNLLGSYLSGQLCGRSSSLW